MKVAPYLLAGLLFSQIQASLSEGGPVGPDGKTEVVCDYPQSLRMRNTGGSDGAGLCVFTSVQNCARWQSGPVLQDFQAFMRQYPGGGYPEKLDKFIRLCAQKQGKPVPDFIQHTGGNAEFLDAAMATGRMVAVTYDGHDMHYGMNATIAHMVNLVHLDQEWAVVHDNNFIGEKQLVWLPRAEFMKRWRGNGGGWAVVLLLPPPPPVPRNG